MDLLVRELTPALLPDWLAFFDGDAFADNRDWGSCYCRYFRFAGDIPAWEAACAGGENRFAMIDEIRRSRVSGVLAYEGGRPIGWCQFGPRGDFHHSAINACPVEDADAVGSIVCFVVAATHRRRGVARTLLRAACSSLAARGLTVAEAYPRREPDKQWHEAGPIALYVADGFEPFRETDRAIVMRKVIGPLVPLA